MKNNWKLILAVLLILLLIWPFPFPKKIQYLDGGTKEVVSLTYKIVWWDRLEAYEEDNQLKTSLNHTVKVYFFPNNFKSIESLWEEAQKN